MKKALQWQAKNLELTGDISNLSGDLSGLRGIVFGLRGDVTGLCGDVDDCEITEAERAAGIDVKDLIKNI